MKIEISHDILARAVFDRASSEDKMRLKIEQFIRQRYQFYLQQKALLRKSDLDYIGPFLETVYMTPDEKAFVDNSRASIRRKVILGVITTVVFILVLIAFVVILAWSYSNLAAAKKQDDEKNQRLLAAADSIAALKSSQYAAILDRNTFQKQLIESNAQLEEAKRQLEEANNKLQTENTSLQVQNQEAVTVINETEKAGMQSHSRYLSAEAKLSLELEKDKSKAYQLAKSSWENDHSNWEACKIIYSLAGKTWDPKDKPDEAEMRQVFSQMDGKFKPLPAATSQKYELNKFERLSGLKSKPILFQKKGSE